METHKELILFKQMKNNICFSKAEEILRNCDKKMAFLIDLHGPCKLSFESDSFKVLVFSIISQQLSSKTADNIKKRLIKLCDNKITPENIIKFSVENIQKSGISNKKALWVRSIAVACQKKEILFENMVNISDERVIKILTQYPGIGRWTAEMFLIFSLGRLDVMPYHDFAIKKSIQKLYALNSLPNKQEIKNISALWKPYRSIASWYLWQRFNC